MVNISSVTIRSPLAVVPVNAVGWSKPDATVIPTTIVLPPNPRAGLLLIVTSKLPIIAPAGIVTDDATL